MYAILKHFLGIFLLTKLFMLENTGNDLDIICYKNKVFL